MTVDSKQALAASQEALVLAEEAGDVHGEAIALRNIAEAHLTQGEIKEAMESARTSLSIFRQMGDKGQQAAGLLLVAAVYLARGRPQEALRYAKDAKSVGRRMGSIKLQAQALSMMCQALAKGDSPKDALRCAKEEREAFQLAGDKYGELMALHDLATARVSKGEEREAIAVVKEALQLTRDLSDRREEGKLHVVLGNLQLDSHRLDEARSSADTAQNIFNEVGDWRGEASAVKLMMCIQLKQGSSDASGTAEEWRSLFYDNGDRKGEAHCLRESAKLFAKGGRLQEAESMAAEAQAMYQEFEDQLGEAEALIVMSEVMSQGGDSSRAVQSAEEALELWKMIEDEKGIVASYQALAKAQMCDDGDAEEGVAAAEKALSFVRRSQKAWATKREEATANKVVMDAYMRKLLFLAGEEEGEDRDEDYKPPKQDVADDVLQAIFEKALAAGERAVQRAMELEDKKLQATCLKDLANSHTIARSHEGALDAANEGLKIAKDSGNRADEAAFLVLMAEVHVQMNFLSKADEEARAALAIFREIADSDGEAQAKKVLDDLYGSARGGGPGAPAGGGVPDYTQAQQAPSAAGPPAKADSGPTKEYILESLQQLSANIVGERLELDSPLMDSGMDSLSSVEFRNQIRGILPGINLPASLVFDHPNLRAMTDFIHDKSRSG